MNASDGLDERDDDRALNALLSPLKQIEPPDTAREELRSAVAAELADAVPVRTRAPWWRRSIEVPVPAALLAMLLLLFSVVWALRPSRSPGPAAVQPQATMPAPSSPTVSSPEAVAQSDSDAYRPQPEYYSSEVYVCGVGRISSVSGYTIREEDHVP